MLVGSKHFLPLILKTLFLQIRKLKTLKHTNRNRPLAPLTYHKYEAEEKLCIVNCLQSYLEKRNQLVNDKVRELLITYGKPQKPVSRDSVGRWIKNELTNAGVDTTVFKPHSCR